MWIATAKGIGKIVSFSFGDGAGHVTISLSVVDSCKRSVDRDLSKIVGTETVDLRIQVTEETALEKRVIRDIDTYFNDMTYVNLFPYILALPAMVNSAYLSRDYQDGEQFVLFPQSNYRGFGLGPSYPT